MFVFQVFVFQSVNNLQIGKEPLHQTKILHTDSNMALYGTKIYFSVASLKNQLLIALLFFKEFKTAQKNADLWTLAQLKI